MSIAGAAVVALSLMNVFRAEHGERILAWAALALLTIGIGGLSVKVPLVGCRLSFSDALIFLSLLLFGTDLATLTGALEGYAASSRRRADWYKRVFNAMGLAITVNIASRFLAGSVSLTAVWGHDKPSGEVILFGMLLVGIVHSLVNTVLVCGAVAMQEKGRFFGVMRHSLLWASGGSLAGALAASVVFLVVQQMGWVSFLSIVPVPVILYLLCRCMARRLNVRQAFSKG